MLLVYQDVQEKRRQKHKEIRTVEIFRFQPFFMALQMKAFTKYGTSYTCLIVCDTLKISTLDT
jgi:hypothetical protein